MTTPPDSFRPVVIVGAGRSGTKILRDSLCRLPGLGTWPCDEINYVWRHGNASYPHDELAPEHARPRVRRFIRRRFERLAARRGLTQVVEKTCANSLRVEFVDRVLPEARFVFLVRDGRDVVASARRRWRAPLDLRYVLRKARFVPLTDVPYYGVRYLRNRIHRLLPGSGGRLAFWGPRFPGMEELARSGDLAAVCARQWLRCVDRAEEAFAGIDPARVHRLRYEDFAAHPHRELDRLCRFLDVRASRLELAAAAELVSAVRIGAWREDLEAGVAETIAPELSSALRRYGYDDDARSITQEARPPDR